MSHNIIPTAKSLLAYRPEIDSLRAVAVIAVLLSHWVPGFAYLLNWGLLGVYLFFVISGYVITRSLLNEKERSGAVALSQFFIRRAIRIWPIYFLVILFIYFMWPGFKDGEVIWHAVFMSNVLFAIKGEFLFPVHFWSLSVEQQFYLFWPFLLLFLQQRVIWICALTLILAPISRWYFAAQLENLPATYFALSSNLDCLAAGALLAISERQIQENRKTAQLINFVGFSSLALLFFVMCQSFFGHKLWGDVFSGTATAGISVWIISWLSVSPLRTRIFMNPFVLYIGKVSYGIYLYHLLIGAWLYTTPVVKLSSISFAAIAFLITLLVASASWILIEQPLISMRRKTSTL